MKSWRNPLLIGLTLLGGYALYAAIMLCMVSPQPAAATSWITDPHATVVATGTVTASTASALSFASPMRTSLIVSNRNGTNVPVYVLLNDSAATPTASAIKYDFVIEQSSSFVLHAAELNDFPIKTLGIYTTCATPLVRAVGW